MLDTDFTVERVVLAGDHHQLPPTVKSFEAGKQVYQKHFRKMHSAPSANCADVANAIPHARRHHAFFG